MDIFGAFSIEAYHWIGLFGRLVDALPVSYAFGAGMLASVNPCGFIMLPASRPTYRIGVNPIKLAMSVWMPLFGKRASKFPSSPCSAM